MATIDVGLPAGRTSVSIAYEAPEAPWAALALAHGAGAAMNHPFLVGFAAALRAEGVATLRFNFRTPRPDAACPARSRTRPPPGPAVLERSTDLAGAVPVVRTRLAGRAG